MMKTGANTWALVGLNFKHFYQRRSLWLLYLVLSLFVFIFGRAFAKPRLGQGLYLWPAAFLFCLGCLVGTMVAETRSRPMAFCLPYHRCVSWWVLIVTGIVLTGISTLLLLHWPSGPPVYRHTFLLAFLSLNILGFWLGVGVCSALGWWPVALPIVMVAVVLFDLNKLLESMMVSVYGSLVLSIVCGGGLLFRVYALFCL